MEVVAIERFPSTFCVNISRLQFLEVAFYWKTTKIPQVTGLLAKKDC